MVTLRRHQLAYLSPAAWLRIGAEQADDESRRCTTWWAAHRLPVVVTRQPEQAAVDGVSVGLPAPAEFGHRRIALRVAWQEILWFDEFPRTEDIAPQLPRKVGHAWRAWCHSLAAAGGQARVYGSRGWRSLTGLSHVRRGSDIDLWIGVGDDATADAVAALLAHAPQGLPRVDGELMFEDGAAVAWREWQAWRSGASRALLVRTIDRSFLRWSPAPLQVPCPEAAETAEAA
ncbi:MAG: malonate decarboxylase holo-[Aquincola sp.]|uniref:malonate decarboxylase holo-[acyl-carrier-protein] synthase n=1 Tax=uncultured Aquincola sp. TaxID=886556 RepID=UPI0032B166C6|nr:malonate decarboxylase holo-[acyl-carrier-protein] synthase [Aquincola sp.]|tara:strand:- start:1261 stop:1953 length:693 start_codon:yes stop_codon:yes gene_type:complete